MIRFTRTPSELYEAHGYRPILGAFFGTAATGLADDAGTFLGTFRTLAVHRWLLPFGIFRGV